MLIPLSLLLQSQAVAPPPTITIPRIEAAIEVDGILDEPVWEQATRLTDFHQFRPADGRPAVEETEVRVWYSPTAIYFGIIAHDRDPGSVRATNADRDNIGGEDRVVIFLDTFNDHRRAYFFGVNPLGVQADGVRSETGANASNIFGGTEDESPDYVFDSKGRLTSEGYVIEVRVPFKSLRYAGGDVKQWGLNFSRITQRTGFEDTWTDVRRAGTSFLAQSGVIDGLTGLSAGMVTEVQPFVTATANGSRDATTGAFSREDVDPSFGANFRLGLTNLTLDGTINPDFSQVESDVGLVTVNERFALFLPEKRPFFLEGIELFATPNQLVYTRRVVEPIAGGKFTGKFGHTGVAYLAAVDETGRTDDALFNLVRVRQDIGKNSLAGVTYTDRTEGSAYNRVLEGDTRVFFAKIHYVEVQYGQSWTDDNDGLGQRSDPIWKVEIDRTGRAWGFNYRIDGIGDDFNAGSGFVPRTGVVTAHIFNRFTWYGDTGAMLENFTTFFGPRWIYHYEDFGSDAPIEGGGDATFQFQLRGGWELRAQAHHDFVRFDPAFYSGIETSPGVAYVPPGELTGLWRGQLSAETPTFQTFDASVDFEFGEVPLFAEASEGHGVSIEAGLSVRPAASIRIEGSLAWLRLDRASDGSEFATTTIPRFKIEYQPTRALFFRVVTEYRSESRAALRDPATGDILLEDGAPSTVQANDGLRTDWLASYEPSPGTVAFFGYGSTMTTDSSFDFANLERQNDGFFVKLAYLFRK
ncbi:MAG TPA: DUF5916 domain-containing protein [Gemmatimonadales bacterium]|nr:DUF5916 domain-containing protein [Gemmatimonadales bacterium]